MPLFVNSDGDEPVAINYNGNPLDRVIYNGVIVWQKAPTEQTVAPTINTPGLSTTTASWSVLNNDSSAATIEARLSIDGSWSSFTNVAAGTNSSLFNKTGLTPKTTYTIEARAQATGELMSEVITRQFTTLAVYHNVQWWNWDGEPIANFSIEKGTTVNSYTPIPSRNGYTFVGWNDGSGIAAFPYTITNDTNFVAEYTPTFYDVIWKNWEGSTLRTDSVQKDTVLTSGDAPAVSRTGYTHTGWSPSLPKTIVANTTFTAQYTLNSYYVRWYDFEGAPIKSLLVPYGNVVQATDYPANPTYSGYTFTGWSVSAPFFMPANDVNIASNWSVNTYTQEFRNWDGTVLKTFEAPTGSVVYAYGSGQTYTYPANPTRTGYTFTGWSKAAPYTVLGANIITANFSINTYSVKWFNGEGAMVKSETVNYGTTISSTSADPGTVSCKYFTGWSPALPRTITSDTDFVAQFSFHSYTITWYNGYNANITSRAYNCGSVCYTADWPANPTRTGYTFTGWSRTKSDFTVYGNETISANWSVNTYYVRWFGYEGDQIKSQAYSYGDTCTSAHYPANPTFSCRIFSSWSKASGFAVYQNWNITSNWVNSTPGTPASCSGSRPFANALSITWSSATCASSYTYEYKLSTASTWKTGSTSGTSSGTITGLTPGTYNIRVKACNGTTCSGYRTGSNVVV